MPQHWRETMALLDETRSNSDELAPQPKPRGKRRNSLPWTKKQIATWLWRTVRESDNEGWSMALAKDYTHIQHWQDLWPHE